LATTSCSCFSGPPTSWFPLSTFRLIGRRSTFPLASSSCTNWSCSLSHTFVASNVRKLFTDFGNSPNSCYTCIKCIDTSTITILTTTSCSCFASKLASWHPCLTCSLVSRGSNFPYTCSVYTMWAWSECHTFIASIISKLFTESSYFWRNCNACIKPI